jgi:hypothetical protein
MLDRYRRLSRRVESFIGFELSTEFVPSGRVLGLDAYEAMIQIPTCIGAKHSSLSRRLEWERIAVRNRVRPEFHVFTGNDLAIDMVRYGSDWLLGLSTAAPEAFAQRDRWWAEGDSRFDELDDALQALGDFAFRRPVPAYKHSMAQALHLRGLVASDEPHPQSPRRPASDREIIAAFLDRETAKIDGLVAEQQRRGEGGDGPRGGRGSVIIVPSRAGVPVVGWKRALPGMRSSAAGVAHHGATVLHLIALRVLVQPNAAGTAAHVRARTTCVIGIGQRPHFFFVLNRNVSVAQRPSVAVAHIPRPIKSILLVRFARTLARALFASHAQRL